MSARETRPVSRRAFLRSAGIAAGAALLAACRPTIETVEKEVTKVVEKEKIVEVTPAPKELVRLRLAEGSWVGPEGIKFWTDEIIPRFELENPGIKVDFESAEAAEWIEKTYAQMVAGEAPDVMFVWGGGGSSFDWIIKGQALLLDEHFDKTYLEDFYPSMLVAYEIDGHLWGIPKYISTICLAYNKDILDDAGVPYPDNTWKWDDYLAALRACTKRDSRGNITRWGTYVSHDFLQPWVWQNKGQWTDTPVLSTRCLLDQPRSLEALKVCHDMIYGPEPVSPKPGAIPDFGWYNVFSTGQIAFMESHSWTVTNYARENDFRWDFCDLPMGPDGTKASLTFANGYIAYAGTRHPQEAVQLIRFLTSPWAEKQMCNGILGLQPARKSVTEQWDNYSIGAQAGYDVAAFSRMAEVAGMEIVYKDPAKGMELFQPIWEQIWITGDKGLEEGVREACKRVNDYFASA
ncbi:MAG: sugar ABC transporter substrate-binding protein [Anaerolineae bacterium]|nr:sugar ABC transporter substrate-binding protein [Anaerolineae bacterium]